MNSETMIVHVGMHKTGTSAIQHSLAANLKDPRFSYLVFERANNSGTLRSVFDPASQQNHTSDGVAEMLRRQGFVAMTRALNAMGNKTPILSAEVLSILPRQSLDRVFDLLQIYRKDIRIVAYMRNLPDYAESGYQEQLKTSFARLSRNPISARYKEQLEHFEQRFSPEAVDLFHFSRKSLRNGCAVQDFCHRLGIEFSPADVRNANERLSLPATRILYNYRKHNPRFRKGDAGILQLLYALPGPKFQIADTLIPQVTRCTDDDLRFAQQKLGVDLSQRDSEVLPTAIVSETQMSKMQPEEYEWLAAQSGMAAKALQANETAVARAFEKLFLKMR